jgi:hypothetical protein
VIIVLSLFASLAHPLAAQAAVGAGGAFELLENKSLDVSRSSHLDGWAYLVSGVAALGISLPAYYLSDDLFAKAVYSLTETMSVAAVGYGSYLVLVDDDLTRFVRIVKGTSGLTLANRNQLASLYLREGADRARSVRKIRVISHGLTAALNFVNAVTASQRDLATALYFLGGVNTLAAVSFAISKTDEEKLYEAGDFERSAKPYQASLDFFVGPVSGIAWRF